MVQLIAERSRTSDAGATTVVGNFCTWGSKVLQCGTSCSRLESKRGSLLRLQPSVLSTHQPLLACPVLSCTVL